MHIEAVTMNDMVSKQILPACLHYMKFLSDGIISLRETGLGIESKAEMDLLKKITEYTDLLQVRNDVLQKTIAEMETVTDAYDKAKQYREHVYVAMQQLREVADQLEVLVDEKYWPIPTYSDLLYNV